MTAGEAGTSADDTVVLSIAPLCHGSVNQPLLVAVHADSHVAVWAMDETRTRLFHRRFGNVTCVATAPMSRGYSPLVWFAGPGTVQCCRLECQDEGKVYLDFLYKLSMEEAVSVCELHTDGDVLIALVLGQEGRQVLSWSATNELAATAENGGVQPSTPCRCMLDEGSVFSGSAVGEVLCALITRGTVWLGCSGSAVLLLNLDAVEVDSLSMCSIRTAGCCAVTSLALLEPSSSTSIVASGLQNGDVVLWSLGDAAVIGHFLEHSGPVCSMTYLPWARQFCSVTGTREVILWSVSCTARPVMSVFSRGVLSNAISSEVDVRCLHPIIPGEVIACASKGSLVLQWSPDGGAPGGNSASQPLLSVNSDGAPWRGFGAHPGASRAGPGAAQRSTQHQGAQESADSEYIRLIDLRLKRRAALLKRYQHWKENQDKNALVIEKEEIYELVDDLAADEEEFLDMKKQLSYLAKGVMCVPDEECFKCDIAENEATDSYLVEKPHHDARTVPN
uniref:Uncharacterized protein TCIL3000_4_1910 n=1 Tax=Trypanosoma congolense (strain IL3000) TaxID=1068625 RepID=G0UL48_TRYCI|nr:unnamed protein product [Trypanosoma congolense IL3000]